MRVNFANLKGKPEVKMTAERSNKNRTIKYHRCASGVQEPVPALPCREVCESVYLAAGEPIGNLFASKIYTPDNEGGCLLLD